ncbi:MULTISPECIES: hypothetical protein [unclassified Pseudoxanthomonas]|uniref:hypothetical protein n=1 Tax=unclassified Pseudoxanthomonas TaxID=2645906 RepID=UPI003076BE4B
MNRLSHALLLLPFLSAPSFACDWQVSTQVDPMTDKVTCVVSSASAKVSFYRYGSDRPNVRTASAYVRSGDGLEIRIDENQAILMGNNAYQRQKALDELLPQLKSGKRIRTSFRDVPNHQSGDAPICNLQQLLNDCS